MLDSHCHFDFFPFASDPQFHLAQAAKKGVTALLVPSVGAENWQQIQKLAIDFPDVIYYALGIHPLWVEQQSQAALDKLELLLAANNHHCVAIGECGLDFAPASAGKINNQQIQINYLIAQLELAAKYNLPVILHCRKAHNQLLQILDKFPKVTGVLHAFTGSEQLGHEYIRRGFYLGVGGSITYPRANKTRHACTKLPLTSLLLETDAPDMPLYNKQGEPNQPANLAIIAAELAKLRNISVADVIAAVNKNAANLFGQALLQKL